MKNGLGIWYVSMGPGAQRFLSRGELPAALPAGDPWRVRERVEVAGPLSLVCDGGGCCFAGDARGERACDAWGVPDVVLLCDVDCVTADSRCDDGRFGGGVIDDRFGGDARGLRTCGSGGIPAEALACDEEGVSAITRRGGVCEASCAAESTGGGVASITSVLEAAGAACTAASSVAGAADFGTVSSGGCVPATGSDAGAPSTRGCTGGAVGCGAASGTGGSAGASAEGIDGAAASQAAGGPGAMGVAGRESPPSSICWGEDSGDEPSTMTVGGTGP